MNNNFTFSQALINEDCDVVDTMLGQGYIPEPDSIKLVCANGNLTLLQTLLCPEKYDMDVQAGLFTAIQNKQTHLLNHLFLAGANVNLPDEDGNTLLHYVKDEETCKWLLDMGAQQTLNKNGVTALLTACQSGYIDIVKLLLSQDQGIQNITHENEYGNTPLLWACVLRRVEIVKLLLSYEQVVQTIKQPNKLGRTPLDKARAYPEILALLQEYI